MQALYRAIAPIPELGIHAGDYLHIVAGDEIPVRLVRHLPVAVMDRLGDHRLLLVQGERIPARPYLQLVTDGGDDA